MVHLQHTLTMEHQLLIRLTVLLPMELTEPTLGSPQEVRMNEEICSIFNYADMQIVRLICARGTTCACTFNYTALTCMAWAKEHLLPNLPSDSVVVLDNASYHNGQNDQVPNSNTKNVKMQRMLTKTHCLCCTY